MDDLSPDCIDSVLECNELLLDLSVNYQKEQLYQEWLTPLTQQAEALSELLTEPEEELPAQWQAFRTAFAQYEPLMRSYLANEVYSELLSFEDAIKAYARAPAVADAAVCRAAPEPVPHLAGQPGNIFL